MTKIYDNDIFCSGCTIKKSHPFNDIKPFISDKKKYHTNTFKTSFIHHLIPGIDANIYKMVKPSLKYIVLKNLLSYMVLIVPSRKQFSEFLGNFRKFWIPPIIRSIINYQNNLGKEVTKVILENLSHNFPPKSHKIPNITRPPPLFI